VFFRKLLRNEPIEIYGNGTQLRDPVYVDDAVEAFLIAGRTLNLRSRFYNIGGPAALPIEQIARIVCSLAGSPSPVQRDFPQELRTIDIGGYASDCSRAQRDLRWSSRTSFEHGASATLDYLRANWTYYQDAAKASICHLQPIEQTVRSAIPA
jgi:UDP-glucose 4-epimerase